MASGSIVLTVGLWVSLDFQAFLSFSPGFLCKVVMFLYFTSTQTKVRGMQGMENLNYLQT